MVPPPHTAPPFSTNGYRWMTVACSPFLHTLCATCTCKHAHTYTWILFSITNPQRAYCHGCQSCLSDCSRTFLL